MIAGRRGWFLTGVCASVGWKGALVIFPCMVICSGDPSTFPNAANKPGRVEGTSNAVLTVAPDNLKFPGVKINLPERCVDVAGSVCLRRGPLELVACTKGTKEHESIVAVEARTMHIHAALLLLGAKPGSPATRRQLGDATERWIDVPPSGGPVDVSLVLTGDDGNSVERPISDFIISSTNQRDDADPSDSLGKDDRFPTNTFLFAGSALYGDGQGPRRYLCDESGNAISLSTFGDELLCLPEISSHSNRALLWQVDAKSLPAVGTSVTLRLRPKISPAVKAAELGKPSASKKVSLPESPQK